MGKFLDFVKSFFGSVWHFLADYLHQAIPEATAIIMKDLLPIADSVISDLNSTTLTGSQKRDAAFNEITSKLSSIGMEVAAHSIYLAIEMAYSKLVATASVPVGNQGDLQQGVQQGG